MSKFIDEWLTTDWTTIGGIILTCLLIYIALLIIVRVNGLRSFSKMSGHDFAVTVAIGSIIATAVVGKSPALVPAVTAIVALLFFQTILSYIRIKTNNTYIENEPLLLMEGEEIFHDNLKKGKVSESDLRSKLRKANVFNQSQIKAVILEATGDVSVIHGDDNFNADWLLKDVRRS